MKRSIHKLRDRLDMNHQSNLPDSPKMIFPVERKEKT